MMIILLLFEARGHFFDLFRPVGIPCVQPAALHNGENFMLS